MKYWNCRLVELNDETVSSEWQPVYADTPKRAATAFCGTAYAWETASWVDEATAIVEVEEIGGESGICRMKVCAYTSLEFSATPDEEEEPVAPTTDGAVLK